MDTDALERPVLAVDVVVFRMHNGVLQVLLVKRPKYPFRGSLALPGVAVQVDETLEAAAKRAIRKKIQGLSEKAQNAIHLEQLAAFDALYRDPRGRTVSVAYLGVTSTQEEHPPENLWVDVTENSPGVLPFDHNLMIKTAVTRLRGKLRYTDIVKALLPETFRFDELINIYETVLGASVNLTNFRTRLRKLGFIKRVRVLTEAVGKQGGRPPHVYRFTHDSIQTVERDFL